MPADVNCDDAQRIPVSAGSNLLLVDGHVRSGVCLPWSPPWPMWPCRPFARPSIVRLLVHETGMRIWRRCASDGSALESGAF
jgi:prepilin-type processing-associated H-X9-DG protein